MSKSAFVGFALGIVVTLSAFQVYKSVGDSKSYINCRQEYPNIPGTVLLENDKVIVQKFTFPPGQWEGVHAHPPNQLYIHLKGGTWKVRFGDTQNTGDSANGSVGWYGPVHLEQDHESVNVGEEPIELIWVTLKESCSSGN